MPDVSEVVAATDAPADRPRETLDARELPPPEPLRRTLERLSDLDPGAVLVQVNDRAPQHLYPQLSERGCEYETVDGEGFVGTVVWRE
jgi:uncharacterized protein (DUF2249 family)